MLTAEPLRRAARLRQGDTKEPRRRHVRHAGHHQRPSRAVELAGVAVATLLSISLGAVVRLAEHLAVRGDGLATLAPRRDVVCVHVDEGPDLVLVGVLTESTQRAVRLTGLLRSLGLCRIGRLAGCCIEHANVEKLGVCRAPPRCTRRCPFDS